MNALVLLAEAGGGGRIEQIARTFGVDWAHLIAQIISFCIVCALLYRFAYHPVLATLEARRQRIAEGLANADKIKAELARTESQRQEAMAQANAQAGKMIEEARAAAARVQEQQTQKALASAQELLARARDQAARDHERMLEELKREIGQLVLQTATAAIGKLLSEEDQLRLAEQTVAAVGRADGAAIQQRQMAESNADRLLRESPIGVVGHESEETSQT